MPVSIDEFWKLVEASELLSAEQCAELARAFSALKGAAGQANARSLAEWLANTGKLTRYQASQLAAGRPGPFVFGPFVVTDRIATGRLARLFQARYNAEQDVLIVFLAQLTDDASNYKPLADLAQTASTVKNPHVSRTYGAVRHRAQSFIVVERLAGESLEGRAGAPARDWQTACRLGFQMAMGLVAMHEAELVHGRVCPRNVWVEPSELAKLLQFPLVSSDRTKRSQEPMVDYLAPELADEGAEDSVVGDVYSLGCLLYEWIAGRAVFPGGSREQKLARHQSEFPQRLDQINPQVPEDLAELVAEMLAKDPLLRCQSASHVAHLLAPFAGGGSPRGAHPPRHGGGGPAPGYGAWRAPEWKAPPPQSRPAARDKQVGSVDKSKSNQNESASTRASKPSTKPAPGSASKPTSDKPGSAKTRPSQPPTEEPAPAEAAIVARQKPSHELRTPSAADAVDVPLVISDSAGATSVALPRRRSSNAGWIGFGAALLLVMALLAALFVANRGDDMPQQPQANSQESTAATPTLPAEGAPPVELASPGADGDNPAALWESPTAGQPLDVAWVPSGAQVLVRLRLAELLSQPEGPKCLTALGPAGPWIEQELRRTLGTEPTQVERLSVAFVPDETTAPQAAYVASYAGNVSPAELLAAWGQPTRAEHAGKSYFQRGGRAYYFPPSEGETLAAIAPEPLVKQMLEADGRPLLRSGVEQLLRTSDDARLITVIFTPSYLLADGKSLLVGELGELQGPIRDFLDQSIEAVSLSAHVDVRLFVECRAVAPIDFPALELVELLHKRWEAIPERVEAHVASLRPQPYGSLVIHRFPRMLQLARDFTRAGVDDGQVVLRTYLPANAAHNLVLGAELTLLETAGVAGGESPGSPPPAAPMSVVEVLQKPVSLSFPRESLDRALELLADELDIEIVILGNDLQLEGITKNQSLNNLDEREQPADAILRKVLKLANPDDKLVYVIKPYGGDGEAVFITTRQAAAKRRDQLPEGF